MSKLPRQKGFTFVELMLVILILAMTAGISGVYFAGTYQKTALKDIAGKLLLMGKYARMVAIEKGESCQIYLDQEQKRFYLMKSDNASEKETPEPVIISNPYCRQATLKNEIEFEFVQINPLTGENDSALDTDRSIYFYPDGSCDAAVIQMGNGRHSMTAVFSSAHTKIHLYEGPADTVEDRMRVVDLDATD